MSAYRPPATPVADPHDSAPRLRHSGIGIASFVISCVSTVLIVALVVVAGVIEVSTPGGMAEDSVVAIVIGLMMFFFVFLALIALGLGIAGLFQAQRRKVFAALGTVLSVATVGGAAALVVIGLTMA